MGSILGKGTMSVNKVIILGNLGKDPSIKYDANGTPIANFSVATTMVSNRNGEKKETTEWHTCVAFGAIAGVVEKYVRKGTKLYVEGYLKTNKWEKDGVTRYNTQIIANNIVMLGGKSESSEDNKVDYFAAPTTNDLLKDVAPNAYGETDVPF